MTHDFIEIDVRISCVAIQKIFQLLPPSFCCLTPPIRWGEVQGIPAIPDEVITDNMSYPDDSRWDASSFKLPAIAGKGGIAPWPPPLK